jgi:Holliday junction resolvasome RuvABC endonuclease subunit
MTIVILAADLATTTGWAVTDVHRPSVPICGSFTLPKRRFPGDYGKRYTELRNQLAGLMYKHKPVMFTIEAALPIGPSRDNAVETFEILNGYCAIAEQVAYEMDVPNFAKIECDKVRKHFIGYAHGKREALKAAVIKQCKLLFGIDVPDDNAADAVAVWDWQTNKLRGDAAIQRRLVLTEEAGR